MHFDSRRGNSFPYERSLLCGWLEEDCMEGWRAVDYEGR
jgi:hypothetical protein